MNGSSYHFAVTAYNAAGAESARSAPVQAAPTSGAVQLPPDPANVAPPVPLVEASIFNAVIEFLYKGDQPIQIGVEEGAIEPKRVAVLRGKVVDSLNEPLAGVKVTVHGYEEFGHTFTRADGMFDMAVNGGGQLVVDYTREGYMPLQRKIGTDWEQYADLPVVTMLPYDSRVTEIAFDSNDYQVAQGSPVTDEEGTRQGTLIVPPNTTGTLVMPDGSTQSFSKMSFRATEYTVGENGPSAMPGELPTFVGYTYAVELSADEAVAAGATEVRFDQPLYYYVDNFLEFPVGETVPIGYYDRQAANWVPSANGRIIGIVSVDGGIAAVDIDGDGLADSEQKLAAIGLTAEERTELAKLYAPGKSLWRVPIEHFTPWDCNWPYGPPRDAIFPPNKRPWHMRNKMEDPCIEKGSIIGCQDQSLGESIPVAGTDYNLHYQSKRTEGYRYKSSMVIPLSDDGDLPDSLQSISVTIHIAGRTFKRSFAPSSGLSYTFHWDGNDAYGRSLLGSHPYTVKVDYNWRLQYYASRSDFEASFARLGIVGSVIGQRNAQTIATTKQWEGVLASPVHPYREAGIGGWSLDNWHRFDLVANQLVMGNGTSRVLPDHLELNASELKYSKGPYHPTGEEVVLSHQYSVYDLQAANDGELIVMAGRSGNIDIYRLTTDGEMEFYEFTPKARNYEIDVDSDGTIYTVSSSGRALYRYQLGTTPGEKIAGLNKNTTFPNQDYDGKRALDVELFSARIPRKGPDGSIYFRENWSLYKVDPDGILSALGERETVGVDNGSASKKNIGNITNFSIADNGGIYVVDLAGGGCPYDPKVSDCYGNRIRYISPEGILSPVFDSRARNDLQPESGVADTAAPMQIGDIELGRDGSVYFMDVSQYRLFRLTPDGKLEEPYLRHIEAIKNELTSRFGASDEPMKFYLLDFGPQGELYLRVAHKKNGATKFYAFRLGDIAENDAIYRVPSADGLQVFEFDRAGRHLLTRNALTEEIEYRFNYDGLGRLISVADAYDNLTTIERDGEGRPVALTAPGGQRTALVLDEDGELAEVTNPVGEAYRMKYENGLLTEVTNPAQGVSRYEYDNQGLLVRAVDPQGGVKTLHRTDNGDDYSVAFTDPDSRTTQYEVSEAGGKTIRTTTDPNGYRIVSESVPGVSETATLPDGTILRKTFGVDPRWGKNASFASEVTYTSPDGTVSSFREQRTADVDAEGKLTAYTVTHTLNGDVSTLRYDAASKKFTHTTAEGVVTETYLNEKDRVSQVVWPGSGLHPLVYLYDGLGRLARMEQGDKHVQYTYNDRNQIVSESDAFGSVKRYQYDDAGRLASVTTPGNRTYGKSYDELGRWTGTTMPEGAGYNQTYNALGQFESFGPEGASWYRSEYDEGGAMRQSQLASGRTVEHLREPDGGKRPIAMNDADIERTFAYVGNSPLAAAMTSSMPGNPTRSQSIVYGYAGENVASMNWSGKANASMSYEYDDFFNLTNIRTTAGGTVSDISLQYDRDENVTQYGPFQFDRTGPLRAVGSISDGEMDIRIDYDDYGVIEAVAYLLGGREVYRERYAHDLRGFVTETIVESEEGTETIHYGYDADGQLTSLTSQGPGGQSATEAYTYDVNKNRSSSTVNGGETIVSAYDGHGVLQRVGDMAYAFDADGYLTSRGQDSFRYGVRGELLEATVTGATYGYTYDAIGRRVAKDDPEGRTTQYLYGNPDALHLLTASIDANGEMTTYYYNEAGLLIALERGGSRYYVITDRVGTPKRVLDGNGVMVKSLRYDSYGKLLFDSNPEFRLEIGYAGGIEDRDIGLTRFGYRDYDAASGRWTARDPILLESGQANLYVYVNNNPVMLRDPCGQFCVGGSAYAGVGAGAKICLTEEGFSSCVEGGFGAGVGLEVTPFEDLSNNEIVLEATAKVKAGISSITAGFKASHDLDTDCITSGGILKADSGPLRIDALNPEKSGFKSDVDGFKPHFRDVLNAARFKAEAAVKAKLCRNLRW